MKDDKNCAGDYYFPKSEVPSVWDVWLQKHIESCPKLGCRCIEKLCELRKKGYWPISVGISFPSEVVRTALVP